MILVCRLIEKWMEQRKQEAHLNIVYSAGRAGVPEGVVRALQDMSVKYADVSISAGALALPQVGSGSGSGVS
jgi:hypothetical protein